MDRRMFIGGIACNLVIAPPTALAQPAGKVSIA
jgi:hypothetical protein